MASDKSLIALIKALKPKFRSGKANDKVAFAIHAFFSASGYTLTATGPAAFSPSALASSSTDEVGIEKWNELDDQYAFVYMNPETGSDSGSRKVLVKCIVMEGKLHVYCALADGSSKHVELNVGDYVEENGRGNYMREFKNVGLLVARLEECLHPLSSEASKTHCVRRIEIESGSGPGPQALLSGRKRKELHTVCEENTNPANMTNSLVGCEKVERLKRETVSMKHVYSTRPVKQKKGLGSDEAVGIGLLLIEDDLVDDKERHDVPFAAPNLPSPKAQPTPASKAGSSGLATPFCSLSSDQILPTPIKKMSPHRLQDGEVYQGRRLRCYQNK